MTQAWQPTNEQGVCMTVAQGTPSLEMVMSEEQTDALVKYWGYDDFDRCIQNLEMERLRLSAQVVELQKEKEEQFLADAAEMTKYVNQIVELQKALQPFANYACDPPCECHNCKARMLVHSTVTRASVPPSVSDGGTPTDSVFVIRSPGKQDYNVTFHNDGKEIGRLDFNGPVMTFTGEADESAKRFFDYVSGWFTQRLQEEREAAIRTNPTLAENE